MTYIVVSENEIVKSEMERPDRNIYDENGNLFWTWGDYLLSLPRIPIEGKHKWEVWQEVEEGKDFTWTKCSCKIGSDCPTIKGKWLSPCYVAIPIQPTPEATLPNCKYCGKFCNPKNEDVVTEDVYGFMGIDDTIFYHKKCKLQQITMENINNWGDVYNEFKRTKAYRLCLAKDLFQTFWQWLNKKYPKGITFPHNTQTK